MLDDTTSIPIRLDDLVIAVVNKDGTLNIGNITGEKLYEAVAKYNKLAELDPAIFTLVSAVLVQSAAIRNLSLEVNELRSIIENSIGGKCSKSE